MQYIKKNILAYFILIYIYFFIRKIWIDYKRNALHPTHLKNSFLYYKDKCFRNMNNARIMHLANCSRRECRVESCNFIARLGVMCNSVNCSRFAKWQYNTVSMICYILTGHYLDGYTRLFKWSHLTEVKFSRRH